MAEYQGRRVSISTPHVVIQELTHSSGNSTVKEVIEAKEPPPSPTVAEKWEALSPTAKIAIYASGAGVGAAIVAFALFYCIRQRRRGAREAKIAEQKAEQERLELERFKKSGIDPDSFIDQATEYNAKDMRREGLTDQNSYSVPDSPATGVQSEKWEKAAAFGAGAGAGAAAAGALRSPVPLLREGAQSPRVTSPTSPGNVFNAPYSDRSPNSRSPAPGPTIPNLDNPHQGSRSPAPLINVQSPSSTGGYPHPGPRSFSSPNTQMRFGSPGPQQAGFGDMQRTNSPGPVAQPMPQRSFTGTGAYGGSGYGSQTQGYSSPHSPQGGSGYGNPNNGGQNYWGNQSYR